jgi:hypothetical protein
MQLLVSYHGGGVKGSVNNVDLADESGSLKKDVLEGTLPPAKLDELRGMTFGPDGNLWVVSGKRSVSQIIRFDGTPNSHGVYEFIGLVFGVEALDALLHPFDIRFPPGGATEWFVSNQDTNVVVGPLPEVVLDPPFEPGLSPWLASNYPDNNLLPGTWVASAVGGLAGHPTAPVPIPAGLEASPATGGPVSNSVRGLEHDGEYLYVADEVANQVKAYDGQGALQWKFPDAPDIKVLEAPVHLLIDGGDLLISSSVGTGQVIRVEIGSQKVSSTTAAPSASGIVFEAPDTLYVGSRKGNRILSGTEGSTLTPWGPKLRDEPEFILPPQ